MGARITKRLRIVARYVATAMAFLALFTAWTPAHAYLDPGSATLLIQGILAAIGGALAYVALFFGRIKSFFAGLVGRKGAAAKPMEGEPDDQVS